MAEGPLLGGVSRLGQETAKAASGPGLILRHPSAALGGQTETRQGLAAVLEGRSGLGTAGVVVGGQAPQGTPPPLTKAYWKAGLLPGSWEPQTALLLG